MRKSNRAPYRNGDFTLGNREGDAVADFRDETGKRRRARLGPKFADLDAAKAALDRFAEAQRAVRKQQAQHTVGDLWRLWMAERDADKLNNKIYGANWVPLRPVFASRAPDLLRAQDYRTYAQARFDAGKSAWTVHTELVRLRSCLKWAYATNLIGKPVEQVWVPRQGKNRDRVLSITEGKALVEGARLGDPHIYLFMVIAFATGARHTAILDLTWDRIDFIAGTIQFDEDLPLDPMSKSWRKGRATVPMGPSVRTALETAYAGRQTRHVIEHGGKRLKSVREGFAAAVRRAGLAPPVTPHTIRHFVATWLEAKAVDDRRRAQLLGHTNPVTTNRYTHSSHELLNEAVSLLDAEFAPLPKIAHSEAELQGEAEPKTGTRVPTGQRIGTAA